jgi:hypothetical protein
MKNDMSEKLSKKEVAAWLAVYLFPPAFVDLLTVANVRDFLESAEHPDEAIMIYVYLFWLIYFNAAELYQSKQLVWPSEIND